MLSALHSWAGRARTTQQQTLADLSALDRACIDHMAHGAMAGTDPLTDSMLQQLDCAAAEGAQPTTTYSAGNAPPPHGDVAWWLLSGALLAAMAGLATLWGTV